MTILESIVLGLVQGITEFLPISSTAHLRVIPALVGWEDPGAAYSAVIQLGTTAAVLLYFAKDLLRLAKAFFDGLKSRAPLGTPDSTLAWAVLIGTLPVGIFGLLLKKRIETEFRSLYVIAAAAIVFSVVLLVVERSASQKRSLTDLTWKDGLWVGCWQALALIPGASRSGTTLTGAFAAGFNRGDAARYSFLLSIPATALAGISEAVHLYKATERPPLEMILIGTVVSFSSGMVAIAGLLRYLRTHSTLMFVVYRVVLGALLLGLLLNGNLAPL